MTTPVVLLGTQANGETLPVQVDATGRLVAEGLTGQPGEPGPPGEAGPPGEPGPPGIVEWPPGAEDGDVLTWIDGQPVWSAAGAPPSLNWSDYLSAQTGVFDPGSERDKGFNGNANDGARSAGDGDLFWSPPAIEILTLEASFFTNGQYNGFSYEFKCSGVVQNFNATSGANAWFSFTRFAGVTISASNPLTITWKRPDQSKANGQFGRLRINGTELIDGEGFSEFYRAERRRKRSER